MTLSSNKLFYNMINILLFHNLLQNKDSFPKKVTKNNPKFMNLCYLL